MKRENEGCQKKYFAVDAIIIVSGHQEWCVPLGGPLPMEILISARQGWWPTLMLLRLPQKTRKRQDLTRQRQRMQGGGGERGSGRLCYDFSCVNNLFGSIPTVDLVHILRPGLKKSPQLKTL